MSSEVKKTVQQWMAENYARHGLIKDDAFWNFLTKKERTELITEEEYNRNYCKPKKPHRP